MASNDTKKYYWLKLTNDFFDNHKIRILRAEIGGRDALLLYIELLAESVTHMGELRCSEKKAYTPAMIGALFGMTVEEVDSAFKLLEYYELLVRHEDGTLELPQICDLVGDETFAAKRKRDYRDSVQSGDNRGTSVGQVGDNRGTSGGQVGDNRWTSVGQSGENVPKRLEIRDKRLEIRDKNKESVSSPAHTREDDSPTLERVLQECNKGTTKPIDKEFAEDWFELQSRLGWKDSKGIDILPSWKSKLAYAWNDESKKRRDKERLKKDEQKLALDAAAREERLQRRLLAESDDD